VKLWLAKKVSSCSLIVNLENSEAAAQEVIKYNMKCGLHLNLTEGRAVGVDTSSLVDG